MSVLDMIMKISFSRKLYSVVFVIVLILTAFMPLLSCTGISATSKVDYSLAAQPCDKDRLFNVDVYVKGKANISAVNVAIAFDSNYMEFRRVTGANDAFEIQHKQSNGKISTIMLCSYGYSFNSKAKLMTFQFKSIKSGSTIINAQISDPVDKELNAVSIGNVYGCKITINGDNIKSKPVKVASSNYQKSESGKEDDKTDKESVVAEEVFEEIDDLPYEEERTSPNIVDNRENNPYLPYIIGGIIAVIVVLIICISYRLGKNNQYSDTNNKDDAEQ